VKRGWDVDRMAMNGDLVMAVGERKGRYADAEGGKK